MSKPPVSPTSLTIEELARLLTAAGGKTVTAEMLRQDIDAGAPVGKDGRVNLVNYAAWLAKEAQTGGR